ncbi:hypothetical protein POM88_006003 [Heracleum sosnowskyi]|uniref:Uncharacterized protein n=1 Tax=Heracleum sosnowskyi TaxID=360622 RepID=A0AAD8J1S5_9APIA|nr:hypothetical protein POM88_006003 [Heracleum sosnowskyi]
MGLRRRSSSFRAFVKSNIIKFTGQIRNITIPEEPTPNLLSLEFSPRTPVLEVRSSGLPDVCSATTLPLPKHFNLISGELVAPTILQKSMLAYGDSSSPSSEDDCNYDGNLVLKDSLVMELHGGLGSLRS